MYHKVVYDRFTRLSIVDASGTIRRMWSLEPLDEDGKLGWSHRRRNLGEDVSGRKYFENAQEGVFCGVKDAQCPNGTCSLL